MPVAPSPSHSTALDHLQEVAAELQRRPHAEIIQSIDRWAAAWEDPDFGPWREVRRLSCSDPAIERALLALVRSARQEPLMALLQEQWGSKDALERFTPRPAGGWRSARSHGIVGAFLGGGASLAGWPILLLSLAARSPVMARIPEADRGWPALFRSSLAEVDPTLAEAVHIAHWPSGDTETHRLLCRKAGIVLAYGSDTTMEKVKALVPASTPFLTFGSRLSAAAVCSDMPLAEAATLLAVDAAIDDGAGCLSPQVVLVEGAQDRGRQFAVAVAAELLRLSPHWSPGERGREQAMAIRTARETTLFEEQGLALGPEDLQWTVLYSARRRFDPSPLGRTVQVRSFGTEADLAELLEPYRSLLQAVGLGTGSPERRMEMASMLADMGATRICPLGLMQCPTLSWSHDGHALLTSLVRFVDMQ